MMRLLLNLPGIQLNLKDGNDMTPLYKAVEINSLPCLKLLVQAGAKVRIPCRDGRTLVEYAMMEFGDACFPVIEYLYKERGLRDEHNGDDHMTLLHRISLAKSHISIEKSLDMMIDCGADVDALEGNGRTPLILATMANRADMVYTLLRSFADVDIYDKSLKTAVRYAKENSE
jgi:ankyrin repeat protein